MFSVKEIKKALTWIFCLYDIDDVDIIGTDFDTVPDMVDALTPDVLARRYKKEAQKVNSFRVSQGADDAGSYRGDDLFPQKAVFICEVDSQTVTTDHLWMESVSELWLLSNLKFAQIHRTRVHTMDRLKITSITDCRYLVRFIKSKEDLFVDAQTLFDALDDAGLFADFLSEQKPNDRYKLPNTCFGADMT